MRVAPRVWIRRLFAGFRFWWLLCVVTACRAPKRRGLPSYESDYIPESSSRLRDEPAMLAENALVETGRTNAGTRQFLTTQKRIDNFLKTVAASTRRIGYLYGHENTSLVFSHRVIRRRGSILVAKRGHKCKTTLTRGKYGYGEIAIAPEKQVDITYLRRDPRP